MRRSPWVLTFVAVLAFFLPGCGGNANEVDGRLKVAGKVSFKGKPLMKGTITFQPSSGGTTLATVPIENGAYYIAAKDGLAPGMYTVRISAIEDPGPPKDPGGLPGPETKDIIPPEYNASSTLTREVKKGVENTFDFDLK